MQYKQKDFSIQATKNTTKLAKRNKNTQKDIIIFSENSRGESDIFSAKFPEKASAK